MDDELLAKLICPKTHKPLRRLDSAALEALNAAISAGGVVSSGGKPVDRPIEAGLLPEGENFVYPILDGIPVLLTDEAIPQAVVARG